MRGPLLKVYKTLHTWVGIVSGMALFICFYAGALTMFKEPLSRWSTPTSITATTWPSEVQIPVLMQKLIATQPDAAKTFTLHVQQHENTPGPFTWSKGEEGGTVLFANSRDGEQLEVQAYQPSAMGELIDQLHQTAGIPGEGHHALGVYVMGAISVMYVLALVSGLFILLPTLMKDFFSLRENKKTPKRFWLDAHNLIGITSLPFHIIIGLTVIVFAFHDQIYASLGKLAYDERPAFSRSTDLPPSKYRLDELLPPEQLIAKVREISSDFIPREMMYRDVLTARAGVRIAGEDPEHMLRGARRGFISIDPYTGEITDTDYMPGFEQGWLDIVITFFALHFGSFGGNPIRWVYFLLGLSGAFLFYTGNLLWVESRRRRQRAQTSNAQVSAQPAVQQARNTRLMAAATVGVCWGSVAGISAAMVAGKWLQHLGTDPNAWYVWVYYAVFLGSVFWAFFRGAGRAAVELLYLSALTTLAIPVTGLLAVVVPSVPAWLHTAPDLLLVEVTALIGGLALVYMARRTKQRIAKSAVDSVWYETGYLPKTKDLSEAQIALAD